MQRIIQKLKQQDDWQSHYEDFNLKNNLTNNPLSRLQDQNIEVLMKHLQKISEQKHPKHVISWVSTQYQILEIVLNTLSVLTSKTIQDFALPEWEQIYNIFPYKLPLTVKYESIRVVQQKKQHRRRWSASEQIFLIEIVKKSLRKNKWNDVARQVFIKSDGHFFRQGKHCRERWLNHLHPSIQNYSWSRDEDIKLLSLILQMGKKWAKIAKKFGMTRSQCMVKKRFSELINSEEQEFGSGESMRSRIKIALEELKADFSLEAATIKQNDKSEQEVDKYQRKSISSKDKAKQKPIKNPFQEDMNQQIQQQFKANQALELAQKQSLIPYAGINTIQNYYSTQLGMEGRIDESFGGYIPYGNYLENPINPLYSYYAHFMPQTPSNMIPNHYSFSQADF